MEKRKNVLEQEHAETYVVLVQFVVPVQQR
jgi:hypothetical protein